MRLVNRAARASWFGLGDALAESKRAVQIMDWIGLVEALDFTAEQMAENRACLERGRKLAEPLRTCNWYLPYFHYAFYGGVHTILRFAVGPQGNAWAEVRAGDASGWAPVRSLEPTLR